MAQQTTGHAVTAAAAARGPRRHGVVDLTPHSSAAVPATSATGQAGAAAVPPKGGEANGAPENGGEEKPTTKCKTPVPLWKARDILLQAVSDNGGDSEFLQARSALSSINQGRGRERRSPPVSGDDVGHDVEHVFSIRLEVRSSHVPAGSGGGRGCLSVGVDIAGVDPAVELYMFFLTSKGFTVAGSVFCALGRIVRHPPGQRRGVRFVQMGYR